MRGWREREEEREERGEMVIEILDNGDFLFRKVCIYIQFGCKKIQFL